MKVSIRLSAYAVKGSYSKENQRTINIWKKILGLMYCTKKSPFFTHAWQFGYICRHLWLLASWMLSIVFYKINTFSTYRHCVSPFVQSFKVSMGFLISLHVLPLKKADFSTCIDYISICFQTLIPSCIFNFQRVVHLHIFIILIVVSLLFILFVWKPFLHGTISSNP